jgi:hypothetical protein
MMYKRLGGKMMKQRILAERRGKRPGDEKTSRKKL